MGSTLLSNGGDKFKFKHSKIVLRMWKLLQNDKLTILITVICKWQLFVKTKSVYSKFYWKSVQNSFENLKLLSEACQSPPSTMEIEKQTGVESLEVHCYRFSGRVELRLYWLRNKSWDVTSNYKHSPHSLSEAQPPSSLATGKFQIKPGNTCRYNWRYINN